MIFLFTDFSHCGPYIGEIKTVCARMLPAMPVIDLMHDAPKCNPRASAYLLAALSQRFQPGDYCLGVVDPDVGMPDRRAVLIEAGGIVYCGPDNGLFSQVVGASQGTKCHEILWRPQILSSSFHGRDLFAPALAMFHLGKQLATRAMSDTALVGADWPAQLDEIIYFDDFGNAITGRKANTIESGCQVEVAGKVVEYVRTFGAAMPGQAFWYENSMGLVEVAMNQGSARDNLALGIGDMISVRC